MEQQFFRGTAKNPTPSRLSRRERIASSKASYFSIKNIFSFLATVLKFIKPLMKNLHIHISKKSLMLIIKEILSTLQFVALLFLFLGQKLCLRLQTLKYIPSSWKEKFTPFLKKFYISSLTKLDPPTQDEISRISLIDLSIRNLLAKKSRTNVTIGGMALGIAAIVFLVSIGYGLQQMVISRVSSLIELKQTDLSTQLGSKIKINDKSLSDFKQIPNVVKVLPLISVVGTINYHNSVSNMAVYGVQADYLQNASIQLIQGKYFSNNSLAMILPTETNQEEPTAVLGAETENSSISSPPVFNGTIQTIQFTLSPTDWIRVRETPDVSSTILGYTKRTEGIETGNEVWGGQYISTDGLGKAGQDANDIWFGKWIKSPVLLWEQKPCNAATQGDCEGGNYMVMRDTDGHQVQKEGYFAASNVSLTGTSLAQGQVLGASTSDQGSQTDQGGIPFVQIASLSAPLQPKATKTVSLGNNAVKQAVVNIAALNILGIKQNEAVGKTFQATFTATGDLLSDPTQNVQSQPTTYTIIGVINGDKTPLFYVPFIDLRSMGLTNYSQARIIVDSKDSLDKVRRQIESEGFVTQSVADTVAQINGVFATAQLILALLGFVALAVASLGMFNTLTVSLLERTREVGLMKAMGMKSEEVKELFLTESLIMAFLGGVLGLLLGFIAGLLLSLLLSIFAIFKGVGFINITYIPFGFILIILGLSLLVGLVTGIYPARRATKISALNALRYE